MHSIKCLEWEDPFLLKKILTVFTLVGFLNGKVSDLDLVKGSDLKDVYKLTMWPRTQQVEELDTQEVKRTAQWRHAYIS